MRRAFLLAAVTISASPAACAFILDFDELQEGSALPGSDASVGDATGDSDCVCTSNDPCRPQECVEGQCVEKPYVGLAYDGYHATFSADEVHRITLAQRRPGAFYGSVFYDDGVPRLKLFTAPFDERQEGGEPVTTRLTTEIETTDIASIAGVKSATPASAAGLTDVGDGVLASFATANGDLYHLKVDANLMPKVGSTVTVGGMYDDSDPTRHPQVWVADDRAYIGWIATNGLVMVPDTVTNTITFGSGAVTNFAPLLTPDGAAVVWAEGTGIFAQHQDAPNPLSLADCPAIAGWQPLFLGGMGLVGPSNALTIAIWTKSNGTSFAAQARAVQCTADMCFLITQDPICPDDVSPGVKTFAALPVQIPEQVYFHQVYAAAVHDAGETRIVLEAAVVDPTTNQSQALGEAQVVAEASELPDLPALAYSGGDKFLIGWIERAAPAEAHLRRYRLCSGD